MKKRPILAITSLLLFSLLLASLYLLERRPLQDRLLDYANQTLGVQTTVGGIGWRWFPVPAIIVRQLRAETATFTLVLPQAHLILNPKFFFSGQLSLTHARLLGPELVIKAKPPATKDQVSPTPGADTLEATLRRMVPADRLTIVDGALTLPEQLLGQGLKCQAITITGLNGTVSARANAISFDLTAASSNFTKSLGAKGRIDLQQDTYQLDLTGDALDSSVFSSIPARDNSDQSTTVDKGSAQSALDAAPPASPAAIPLPRVIGLNFSAHLAGQGNKKFQLQLDSNNSPFTLSWREQTFQIAMVEGLALSRQDDAFSIDIKELAFAEPRLRLNGRVARQLTGQDANAAPEWGIDLKGADIDLAAVRAAILANFNENPIAQKVCAIVGGGSATTARYTFQGGLADFQHLSHMKIWAEAKDIPISLPALPLFLDQASGPIAIIDGQLTGQNLSATIDKSHGTNGNLLLDLAKEEHGFHLDLDLDVDLQNLQDVLAQIIPSPAFHAEVGRFQQLQGRAQGQLRLGEDLRQIKTEVEVKTVEASGLYDRLPWPFTISQGELAISPQQVAWEEVHGSIGAHKIKRASGVVTWQNDIRATIKALDADLDLKSLFADGTLRTNTGTLALRDFIDGVDELAGQARLSKSSFSGPLKRPHEWQFNTAVNFRNLKVARSGVPELDSQDVEAEINHHHLDFTGVFALLDQELFLSGHYDHSFFEKWHGDLEINGEIGQRLAEWLQEQDHFPAAAYLKHPFRVEKFIITNQDAGFDSFLANGTILPATPDTGIRLQVANSRQNNQRIDTFTFYHGDRQGILSYQVWPDQNNKTLLTWQGELASETVDALFPQPFLQSGQMQGSFSRLTDLNSTTYSGSVEANDIRFLPDSLTPDLTIDTIRLQGSNNIVTVAQADLALAGTPASIAGRIAADPGSHALNLHVNAPKLAWKSIQKLFDVYSQRKTTGDQEKSAIDSLRGVITFDIGAFDYVHQPKNPTPPPLAGATAAGAGEESSHTFTSAPFLGRMELTPAGIALRIDKSKVCGISSQGTWHFGNETEENTISFSSGKAPLSFAEALPCLGIKQSLILGPFSLTGQISGRPNKWRQGDITLLSSEGLIKRMTLLSKIFTAVNFADYLTTWHDLPDMQDEGLFYNDLILKAHVDSNTLILDRTVIKGKGVNLSGRGTINLTDLDSDLTFFIAPFKGLDWVVSNLPLIGKALAGPKESILTFPVAVTGNIKSPEVTALAPTAIGSAFLELFRDAITLPFRIFQPEPATP